MCLFSDIPVSCDHVLTKDSSAKGGAYEIDPDGPGGVDPFEVNSSQFHPH